LFVCLFFFFIITVHFSGIVHGCINACDKIVTNT
jgi:hypothetical protein